MRKGLEVRIMVSRGDNASGDLFWLEFDEAALGDVTTQTFCLLEHLLIHQR